MSALKILLGTFATTAALSGMGAQVVSGVTVQQHQPSDGKVEIHFNLSGAGDGRGLVVWAVDQSAGVTNVARHVTGDTACSDGAHTIVWDMAADGLATVSDSVIFGVNYSAPLYCVIDLSGGSSAKSYPISYLADVPEGGWSDTYKTTKLVLRRIKAGTFMMGSADTDPDQGIGENPQHKVTLSKDFWIGVFECTQYQWKQVMGYGSFYYSGDTLPADMVYYYMLRGQLYTSNWPNYSGADSDSLIGKLRQRTGLDMDIPTEAQWEYACRAGTTTGLNSGKNVGSKVGGYYPNLSEVGRCWQDGRSGGPLTVGSLLPNAWGLYDMHGNVAEWCRDWYGAYSADDVTNPTGPSSGTDRVIRGGSYGYFAYYYCRSASRWYDKSTYINGTYDYGVRLYCSESGTSAETPFAWSAAMPLDLRKKVETPTISAPASFVGPRTEATLGCPTAGAALHYTLDGSEPTDASPVYVSALFITNSCVIKVVGILDGYSPSATAAWTVEKACGRGDALDWPYLTFAAESETDWTVDSAVSHDGGSSLRSGVLADGQSVMLTTTVSGKGKASFWWKTSCESASVVTSRDHASFETAEETDALNGESSWVKVERTFATAGEHVLTWTYQKDSSGSSGSDCVWIDGFNWLGEDALPDLGATASVEAVAEATWGSADPLVNARIVQGSDYASYRAWASTVKTSDGFSAADAATVKASPNAWLSYALGSEKLLGAPLQDADLTVEAFAPAAEAGKYEFAVSVDGVKVGGDALKENLKQVFGLEGAGSLASGAFSSDNVDIVFGKPENGMVKFAAGPKGAQPSSFFMKVKVVHPAQ